MAYNSIATPQAEGTSQSWQDIARSAKVQSNEAAEHLVGAGLAGGAHGKRIAVALAHDDAPSCLQSCHRGGIVRWCIALKYPGRCGGLQASCAQGILQPHVPSQACACLSVLGPQHFGCMQAPEQLVTVPLLAAWKGTP